MNTHVNYKLLILSMIIKYYKKNIYGKKYLYVKGEAAPIVKRLTGKKTITQTDIEQFRLLGVDCREVLPVYEVET